MKKTLLLFLIFLLSACAKEVRYTASFILINKTGYDIEIFKGAQLYKTVSNDKSCQLFSGKCRANAEALTIGDVINDTRIISLWKINSNEFTFLKEWTYENRNESGKQLFRLSDYTMSYTISDYGGNFIPETYCYEIFIYPTDLQ